MRVVFLDFDGVLNSWRYFKDAHEAVTALRIPQDQIDRKAVRWLNEILAKSGAVVVVSSPWRLRHALDDLKKWLGDKGFVGEVIGSTPDMSWRKVGSGALYVAAERGHEIDAWLREHPEVVSFVILDDGNDMAMHATRLVQTTVAKGLKPKHVAAALALLEEMSAANAAQPPTERELP